MMSAFGYLLLAGLALSAVICYKRPSFALVLVLVFYTYKQLLQSYLPIFAFNSPWFNYLVAVCVGVAVVSSLAQRGLALVGFWNKFYALLLFLYAYAIFGILYSPSGEWALDRWRDGAPYWLMQVVLLPLAVPDLASLRKTFTPFLIVGLLGIVLFFTNPYSLFYGARMTLDIGKIIGIPDYRGNPLATAQMGGMLAIVAALMLPTRVAWFMHLLRISGVFLGLGIAVVAGSRAQVLLAIMVIVFFWPMARRVRDVKQFLLSAAGLTVLLGIMVFALQLFLTQSSEQAKRWTMDEQTGQLFIRSMQAWRLLEAWLEEPAKWVFGLGTNAYSYIDGSPHSYAHNLLVEMLGELGLVGLTITLVLLWWAYALSRELWSVYREDPAGRATATALLALGAYLTALSMKQGTFLSIPEPWFILVLVAKYTYVERHALAHQIGLVEVAADDPAADEYAGTEQPSV